MKKKIIGLLVCTLLIATTLPAIGNSEDSKIKNSEVEIPYCNYYFGYTPLPDTVIPDEIGELGSYPSSWDWRDAEYAGSTGDWITSVKSQGCCGSCWAFSAIGTLEAIINIRESTPNLDVDLSEQYLLSCPPNSGGCDGWSSYYAFEFMKNNGGAIPESCFPYQADDTIPCSDKCDDWLDHLFPVYAIKYYKHPNRDAIKSIIVNDGPLSVNFDVYEDFHDYSWGVYRHEYGEYVAGHAVVLIGYDDSESCWICKNSWGSNWGENGYFRIGYGECELEKDVYLIDYDEDTVNWPPEADAGELRSAQVGETIHFNTGNTSDIDNNIISYEWDFGDGTTSTEPNTTHAYSKEGIYNIELTVVDENGMQDTDESAAFVDLWQLDDTWIYNMELDIDFRDYLVPIFLEGSVENFKLSVSDESKDKYKLDFSGDIDGHVSVDLDVPDILFNLKLWGKLKRTSLDGEIHLTKAGFGIEELKFHLHGRARLIIMPFLPIPIWIPVPFDITIIETFDPAPPLLGFSPEVGKTWTIPSTVTTTNIKFSTLFGIISKSFTIEDISQSSTHTECTERKNITVPAGTYESYKISVTSMFGDIACYYAPEVNNIVKIQIAEEPEIYINCELKSIKTI